MKRKLAIILTPALLLLSASLSSSSADATRGITAAWHTADFDLDEESLVVGVKVMSNVLLDYLDRHSGGGQKP